MGGEIDRPDWSEGDGSGSDRAGAGHEEPVADWKPVGDPKKGAQRYSGALADLDDGKEAPGQEVEPANPQEVTQEERQEIISGIEDRASEPTPYENLSEDTKALLDEGQYENVAHEIGGAREHLSHEEYDQLEAAIDGMPKALNQKLLVALGSGEFEDLVALVEHLSDDLSATQTAHLRRAIEEMPSRIREGIGF